MSCDQTGATIEVDLPEFTIESMVNPEGEFSDLSIPGWGRLSEEGMPSLPQLTVWVAIPPGAAVHLAVEPVQTNNIPLRNPLPSSTWKTDAYGDNHQEYFIPDHAVYTSKTLYPADWALLGDPSWLRMFNVVPVRITPVRCSPGKGEAIIAEKLLLRLTFRGGEKGEFISDPFGDILAQTTIINFDQAQSWRKKIPVLPRQISQNYGHYKLLTTQDGLYLITFNDLVNAGIDPNFDPQTLKIYLEGEQIPIWVEGEWDAVFDVEDYILYYGTFPRGTYTYENIYTDTNVYWLDWGGEPGLRLTQRSVVPGSAVQVTSFKAHTRIEFDIIYDRFGLAPLTDNIDHWMWQRLDTGDYPNAPQEFSYLLDLPGLVIEQGENYDLSVSLRGLTYSQSIEPDHHVTVTWNGYPTIDEFFTRQNQLIAVGSVPWDTVRTQNNELIFRAEPVPGVDPDPNAFYLDWLQVDYWRDYGVINDTLFFQSPQNMGPGDKLYELMGLQSPNVELWNLTRMERLIDFEYSGGTLAFQDSASDTTYYFVAGQGNWLTPEIIEDEPSNWMNPIQGADYLIITHEDFYEAIQPLVQAYSDSMRVALIKIGDIYDEFSYGIKTPQAIFDFTQYAYFNYQGNTPAFVLLVGDASWDYKNNDTLAYVDFVPTHSFMSWKWGETSADNWFASVSGQNDPLPELYIGRFPVNTPEETNIMVNKSLNYMTSPPGYWRTQVIFTNGAFEDLDAVSFDNTVQVIIDNYFPEWYDPPRVYSHPSSGYEQYYGSPQDLAEYINRGAAMVNYLGHAGNQMWETMDASDLQMLYNTNKLPFVAAFSCFTGIFSNTTGFGELFVLKEEGGAVAYWANTAIGYLSNNAIMDSIICRMLFENDSIYFGAATAGAKWAYFAAAGNTGDVINTFTLLGDPAAKFIFIEPVPDDTMDVEPPEITFLSQGDPFPDEEFISNPVNITCVFSDNIEIVTTYNQLILTLTRLTDEFGFPVPPPLGDWSIEWSPESLNPPDSTGHEFQITITDSLPAGEWELYTSTVDYLGNSADSLVNFMISSGVLAINQLLYYNHPGSDETTFAFSLNKAANVTVKVYTVAGRLIWTATAQRDEGYRKIHWNGRDQQGDRLSNGTYIYKVIAKANEEKFERTEKMIKIR